jgi:serine/threonine protein kinase
MSYCINPDCSKPHNPDGLTFCQSCGSKLALKDRYYAVKPIGQGGFGRTFLAIDEDKPSKPPCVIKQFHFQPPDLRHLDKAIELFNREAHRLDELGKHPQIPELFAYFIQDNRQYLVQEFIDGQNLEQEWLHQGNFSEQQITQILIDLLPVVQFLHDRQVIHRDLKPENIIRQYSTNKLFIVDFGAAKVLSGTEVFQVGTSIGSPEYIAPEQARGQAMFCSDLYSLGVTCLKLLTGISPFDLYDVNEDRWIWRDYLTTPVSDRLAQILDRLVAMIPSQRYPSARAVMQDLNLEVTAAVLPSTTAPSSNTPSLPTTTLQPPATVTPPLTPAVNVSSQVDLELAEIRSQFTGANQPTPALPNSSPQRSSHLHPTTQNPIEVELAELRSEFLGKSSES